VFEDTVDESKFDMIARIIQLFKKVKLNEPPNDDDKEEIN